MEGVLLVVMPFGSMDTPPIGISTLKAQLQQEHIECDIIYFNLQFARAIGHRRYMEITNTSGEMFIGEWLFSRSLFKESAFDGKDFVKDVLKGYCAFPPEKVRSILDISQHVEPFLDHCMRSVDWQRYGIVGFTSMFEQNLSVLCLAKRVKEKYPDKITVMGGANCAGVMGLQLHNSFPFIDYIFTGEADLSFPEFVKRLKSRDSWKEEIKDLVWRDGKQTKHTGAAPLIEDLDRLPYPNYDDYFEQYSACGLPQRLIHDVSVETSRGCWWGQKRQCNFCGLNHHAIRFRYKSPQRALDEINYLAGRYDIDVITAVDNIMPVDYFKTLLPALKRRRPRIRLFYETKANLKEEQVKMLSEAGVARIQPGIEAFSPNVLRLMGKGVSPFQNIQLLKWCRDHNLAVAWNLLYGFPGENAKDYRDTLEMVRSVSHLHPPMACGWIRSHRFSPMFNFPEKFGIRHMRPLKTYRYIYPFDESVLSNIAYNFEFDFDGMEKMERLSGRLRKEIERWQLHQHQLRLEVVERTARRIKVIDTRMHRLCPVYVFKAFEKDIIEYCDHSRSFDSILDHLRESANGNSPSEEWIQNFLNFLVRHRLMLHLDGRFLNIIRLNATPAVPPAQ